MGIIGNIIWLIFGGIEIAFEYFFASFILAITIIGIPFALQTVKLGIYALWPFGQTVVYNSNGSLSGCATTILNLIWLIFGGIWICLSHLVLGVVFCITIIGIPFGLQHFKLATLALAPFGRTVISK